MQIHTIRFCEKDEWPLLIDFIRDFWRDDHVFVKSKEMLDWQYFNQIEQRYNFVVAYNKETSQFDAILGFIPVAHFDSHLLDDNEFWLAIWRLKESASKQVSGLNLLHFLRGRLKPKSIYAIGISAAVEGIYRVFNYDVDTLSHYYIKRSHHESILAAHLEEPYFIDVNSDYSLQEIHIENYQDDIKDLIDTHDVLPKKSFNYFVNRYIQHPWFKYKFIGLFENNRLLNVIVYREMFVENSACLRIMDWIGKFQNFNIAYLIQSVLKQHNAEYIDFLCKVNDEELLLHMGFQKKNISQGMIIPEYFNPFIQSNVDITYAAKASSNYMLVKGDSDQDRPNVL